MALQKLKRDFFGFQPQESWKLERPGLMPKVFYLSTQGKLDFDFSVHKVRIVWFRAAQRDF